MKKYLAHTIIGLFLVFIIVVVGSNFLHTSANQAFAPTAILTKNLSLPTHVLAINMELKAAHDFTEDDILNGNAPLLAVMNFNNVTSMTAPFIIQDFKELSRFDTNKNGRIEPVDSLYKDFYLVYLQPNGSFNFVKLSKAGVHAIYINQSHLFATNGKIPGQYLPTTGSVLLADSSRRPVVVLNIQAPLAAKIMGDTE